MLQHLSSEWFETAFDRVRGIRLADDLSARLRFVTPTARWHLVIGDGRVIAWSPGDVAEADVEIRWDDESAARILARELRGNDALLATTVVATDGGGTYTGPPAPLNLATRPETSSLPTFPDASFSAQFTYHDGPFGVVDYALVFEDGRLADERLTRLADPDAIIECGYLTMARTRAGEATILEALETGSVRGDIGALAALGGIFESPEFHAVELASGRHAFASEHSGSSMPIRSSLPCSPIWVEHGGTVNEGFSNTLDRLHDEIDEGVFTRGLQAVVEVGGERMLDVALGDAGTGVAMTGDHVLRVYCTGKPILALAVAQMVDDGVLDLDAPLVDKLPECRPLEGGVTLRHVLTHTAGLHHPSGVAMEMVPPDKRRQRIEASRRPGTFHVGVDAAYSEYAGWQVMGWVVEQEAGVPLREHLRARVLDPLDMRNTWIGMTPEEYAVLVPRLGVNHEMRQGSSLPMLFERTQRVCTETNPSHGCYASAGDLARFYSGLLDGLDGDGLDAMPSASTLEQFTSIARPAVPDSVLERVCSYGLGFMTPLHEHAFGEQCSEQSFGHSGNIGASFAFADPEHGLAVGIVFNGLVGHEAAFLRRRSLVGAIYADLAEQVADAATDDEPEPRRRGLLGRFRSRG